MGHGEASWNGAGVAPSTYSLLSVLVVVVLFFSFLFFSFFLLLKRAETISLSHDLFKTLVVRGINLVVVTVVVQVTVLLVRSHGGECNSNGTACFTLSVNHKNQTVPQHK